MTVKIKIDLSRVQQEIGRIPQRLHAEVIQISRATAQFGRTAVQHTIASTHPIPVARGTYRAGWTVQDTPEGAVLLNRTKQAYFVEMGRRPGKWPPLAPILDWMRAKGIVARNGKGRFSAQRGLAFVIRRKIGTHGTKARHVLGRTFPLMRQFFSDQLAARVKRRV